MGARCSARASSTTVALGRAPTACTFRRAGRSPAGPPPTPSTAVAATPCGVADLNASFSMPPRPPRPPGGSTGRTGECGRTRTALQTTTTTVRCKRFQEYTDDTFACRPHAAYVAVGRCVVTGRRVRVITQGAATSTSSCTRTRTTGRRRRGGRGARFASVSDHLGNAVSERTTGARGAYPGRLCATTNACFLRWGTAVVNPSAALMDAVACGGVLMQVTTCFSPTRMRARTGPAAW
jgi:hypothetical protein